MQRRLLVLVVLLLTARPARAFDYLEHTFFTDHACRRAQARLGAELNEETAPAYLALALACPERWDRPYCAGGYKQLEGGLNDLARPPAKSHDQSVTLGDLAALPDHLSEFGALRGVPRAEAPGLTSEVLSWLRPGTGDPGGVIADVAEDACETEGRVDWDELAADLQAAVLPSAPDAWLQAPRAQARLGPTDPAGPYSFDNPHYLDLILMNGHHFGARAYESWLGFHAAAVAVSGRRCETVLALDRGELEDLADGLPGDPDDALDDLDGAALRVAGCRVLARRVAERLQRWASRAEPALVAPAEPWLRRLPGDDDLAERTATALMGLVLEGAGLHFLQDGLAGGHLRMDRSAYGLGLARQLHDADNRQGVVASTAGRGGAVRLVAWGDSHLLGRSTAPGAECTTQAAPAPAELTACLLRLQRKVLIGTTEASLLDWSLGGASYAGRADAVCAHLPTRAPSPTAGSLAPGPARLAYASLPQVPPPFSYQSLSMVLALDGGGGAVQTGGRLQFLSALGRRADWMTSWSFGLLATQRPASPEFIGELAYVFHWRWAARWLINAGPFAYTGLRGFGDDVSSFTGLGASAGTTLLPEGWTKLPLEISFTYRLPLTLLDSREGLFGDAVRIEAHWIEISLGLAFL